MRLRAAALICATLAGGASADAIDETARAAGSNSAEDMALAGVVGKTADALKDPRSMVIVDAYTKRSPDAVVGCLSYRAKNSFNANVPGTAVWRLSGKRPAFSFRVGSAPEWNRYCAGKGFHDQKDRARMIFDIVRDRL